MKHKSQPVSKTDARIVRTRSAIDQALVQLLFQRTYRSINVHDITRKAGVGRATFYAHYDSKDQLLRSQLTRLILPLLKNCPQRPWLLDCTALFDHVLTAPQLFRNIMSGGEGSGARVVRAAFEDRVHSLLEDGDVSASQLPQELVKRFVVSTLLTVILHGLQSNGRESAAQFQSRFARLTGAGLSGRCGDLRTT